MYKAIYPYCHDNPKILSFNAGDKLIVLKQNENNWWLAQKRQGHIGLVPSNYIVSYTPDSLEFLEFIMDSSTGAPYLPMYFSQDCLPLSRKILECYKEKLLSSHPHLLQFLQSKQVSNDSEERLCGGENNPGWKHSTSSDDALASPSSLSAAAPESSSRASSSLSSSNFRLSTSLSPPPIMTSPMTQNQFPDPILTLEQPSSSSTRKERSGEKGNSSGEERRNHPIPRNLFWSLVSQVREAVDVDFNSSCSVVRLVLDRLGQNCPSVSCVMDEILQQENVDHFDGVANDKSRMESILETTDAKDLQEIFSELSQTKDDSQQRSWALHEDEGTLSQMLKKLLSILVNANPEICRMVVAKDHYEACNDLILYYQMETRSSLRMLILEIFANVCSLGTNFISELVASVLPLELARELQDPITGDDDDDAQNLVYIAIVLCMVFSTGETVPHNHYSHLNEDFIFFILSSVGSETETSCNSPEIPELLVKLLLSFNLHFETPRDNLCMKALRRKQSAKYLTEQILLLFNREEDPIRIPGLDYKAPNSVMKFLSDMFSHPSTSAIFYTNDARVLVDILLRQLIDLNPGDEMRTEYLALTHLLMTNSTYFEHKHRLQEMKDCLQRIHNEEEQIAIDRDIVSKIFKMFQEFSL